MEIECLVPTTQVIKDLNQSMSPCRKQLPNEAEIHQGLSPHGIKDIHLKLGKPPKI